MNWQGGTSGGQTLSANMPSFAARTPQRYNANYDGKTMTPRYTKELSRAMNRALRYDAILPVNHWASHGQVT